MTCTCVFVQLIYVVRTKQLSDVKNREEELKKLQQRHNAALDLLGEKEERIADLQQDLAYVKETFRKQMETLLAEIEKLKKKNVQ